MPIAFTRAIIRAVLSGALADVKTAPEPVFKLEIPVHCPDVPDKMLMPREVWNSAEAYDAQAERLVKSFRGNFTKHFGDGEAAEIAKAGP